MSDPTATPSELLKIQSFFSDLGLPMLVIDEQIHGFVEGVRLKKGVLEVGSNATIDSLLHEAGHLATTPAPFRALMSGDLARGQRKMCEALEAADLDPQSSLIKHAIQCSDPEATAWAFAAGRALGFPDEITILDSSYDGDGASIRLALALSSYSGINGLTAAGMCSHGMSARMKGLPTYPHMLSWVQDGPYPEWPQVGVAPTRARRLKMG